MNSFSRHATGFSLCALRTARAALPRCPKRLAAFLPAWMIAAFTPEIAGFLVLF